jgi:hypothetical protein
MGEAFSVAGCGDERQTGAEDVVRLDDIRKWLVNKKAIADDRTHGRDGMKWLEPPQRISAILKGCGLYVPKQRFTEAGKHFRVVSTFSEIDERWNWEALKEQGQCECRTAEDLDPF